jgi:hypothetical protein
MHDKGRSTRVCPGLLAPWSEMLPTFLSLLLPSCLFLTCSLTLYLPCSMILSNPSPYPLPLRLLRVSWPCSLPVRTTSTIVLLA